MDVNRRHAFTYFAGRTPTQILISQPDVTIIRSPIPSDAFNYVLLAHFTKKNIKKRIRDVLNYFDQPSLPLWWWWSESDTPAGLDVLLQEEGLILRATTFGMYARIKKFPLSSSLSIKRVLSFKQLKDFSSIIEITEECPHIFDLFYRHIPPSFYQEGTPYEFYVGYLEKTPVTAGVAFFHTGVMGIYYLSTLPSYRKKGYASALIQVLLNKAYERKAFLSTLQATEEGYSLYTQLGFTPCCQFKEFVKRV